MRHSLPFGKKRCAMKRAAMTVALPIIVALIGLAREAAAQPSPRLPLGDPVYEELDQVAGSGLVTTIIYGQRPWTRAEVARIVAAANEELSVHAVSSSTRRVLARLSGRFAKELRASSMPISREPTIARWIRPEAGQGNLELLGLDSPSRDIPTTPVGGVAADLNPVINERGGRRYAQGETVSTEWNGAWTLGNRALLALQPRLATGGGSSGQFSEATLQGASLGFESRNLVVEVGRQPLVWGQGMAGGLLLSTSGRPLDMIRVATARPWRAPWVFRWLGMLRGSAFLADLGPHQNFPHAKIAAYKLSGDVTSYFEFSAAVLVHEGGRGSPSVSPLDRLIDFIPAIKYAIHGDSTQFSNKLAGFDSRFRIPALHGLQLYTEHVFDDADPRRWKSTLWQDTGHILGLSLAQLGPQGAMAAAAEFHHTGIRYYEHATFISGVAFNRTLLGDPLGPQGDGGYLRLRHDAGGAQTWRIDAAVERRGGDVWGTRSVGPHDAHFTFVLERHQPAEWRHRLAVQWSLAASPRQRLTLEGGVERVRDAGFVAGARRVNRLGAVEWTWLAW